MIKRGNFLTEEERKQVRTDYYEGVYFKYVTDLSEPVKLYSDFNTTNLQVLSKAITQFIGMWTIGIWCHLNGFSGLDSVRYEFYNKGEFENENN